MDPIILCHFLWDLRNFSESGGRSKITSTTKGLRYTSFVIFMTVCVLGLVGNCLVIWVTGFKMKNVKAMTWFLNLAVADLVFLLCLPMRATSLFLGQWDFGGPLCKAFHFLSNMNMYVSIFIITALSIDRCLSVALPLWHREVTSKRLIRLVCLVLWIVTLVMSIPGFLYSDVETTDSTSECTLGFFRENPFNASNIFLNSSSFHRKQPVSGVLIRTVAEMTYNDLFKQISLEIIPGRFGDLPLHRNGCQKTEFKELIQTWVETDELEKWNAMVSFAELLVAPLLIIGFLVPLVIITLTNIIIIIQAKRSPTKTSSNLYKIVVAVVTAYFLSWTPLAIVEMVSMVAARSMDFHLMHSMSSVLPLASSIASLHSCLNPILYVLLSQSVRSNLAETISSVLRSLSLHSESA